MASNTINIGVDVTSNLAEVNKAAERLRDTLKEAAKVASSINIPSGGSSSQRSASQTRTFAAASQQASTPRENLDYRTARGVTEATGAASRDFAKQAQGLGGLVHLYATFAANLFAVSAAFTALKNAADTTNMIKGLDQLGAASGRNLGQLSKEVVKMTDGAVSLREAMEATAKASSAGMSNASILKMAEGAKKASQALGMSMPDALSRLSRGITKLEPELLDELGIFVRVDKAAEDYARSIGKSTSSLTEFERRTAFAVAVQDQMIKKFGDIELAANPYDKLLSSLKDITQTGLELVNKVFGPIAKLLSESPTGLTAALLAVGVTLLKQAIPAISSVKEEMGKSVEISRQVALARSQEATKAYAREKKLQAQHIESMAEKELEAVSNVQDKIAALKASGDMKKGSGLFKALDTDPRDVTPEKIARLESSLKGLRTRAFNETDAATKASYAISAKVHEEGIALLKERILTESKYDAKIKEATDSLNQRQTVISTVGQNQKIADKANLGYISKNIVANAGLTASLVGYGAAWRDMNEEIRKAKNGEIKVPIVGSDGKPLLDSLGNVQTEFKKLQDKGISPVQAGMTRLKGIVSITTGVVGTAISAFGFWGQAISVAAVAFSFLNDYMSNTVKEAKDTADAIGTLTASTESLSRTIDFISKKSYTEFLSVESIQARATAVGELGAAMLDAITKANKQFSNMNTWDKSINFIKGFFKQDLATDIGESLSSAMSKSLEGIDITKNSGKLEKIRNELGVSSLFDKDEVSAAFTALERNGEAGRRKAEEIAKQIKQITSEEQIAAAKATEFKQALDQTAKSFKTFANSFIPSDSFSKLGADIMAQSEKMSQALEDPKTAIASLYELTKNPESIALLPKESINTALDMRSAIKGLYEDYAIVNKQITDMTVALEANEKIVRELDALDKGGSGNEEYVRAQTAIANLKKLLADKETSKQGTEAGINTASNKFAEVAKAQFAAGAQIIGERLSAEWGKAGTAIGGVVVGILGDSKEAIAMRGEMERKQLSAQAALLKSQSDLIRSNYYVAETIRMKDISEQLLSGKDITTGNSITETQRKTLETERATRANGINEIFNGSAKGIGTRMADTAKYSQEAIKTAQQLEGLLQQISYISEQIGASKLKQITDEVRLQVKEKYKDLELEKQLLDARMSSITSIKMGQEFTSVETVQIEKQVALQQAKQASLLAEQNLQTEIAVVSKAIEQTSGTQKTNLQNRLLYLQTEETSRLKISADQKEQAINEKYSLELLQEKSKALAFNNKLKQEELSYSIELAKEQLNTSKTELDFQKNNGIMSEVDYAKESFKIRKEALVLEGKERTASILAAKEEFSLKMKLNAEQYTLLESQARATAADYRAKAETAKTPEERKTYEKAASASDSSASTLAKLGELSNSQAEKALANYDRQIERQQVLNAEKEKQLAIEERSAVNLARLTDLGNMLGTAFGQVSSNFMPVIQAFSSLGTSLEGFSTKNDKLVADNTKLKSLYEEQGTALEAAMASGDDSKAAKLFDEKAKTQKLLADNETAIQENTEKKDKASVEGTMKVLSASKKLFKEKTVAHKLISGMEKAYMTYKLVMGAKEIAMDAMKLGSAVATSLGIVTAKQTEMTAAAGAAITNQGTGDPYTAFARIAAMIALMASITGESQGGGGGGISAEQLQAVQGTGMDYVNGQLVDNGGGALGDANKVSTDIADSLEYIEKHTNKTLQYNNAMLESLQAIEVNTANFVASLYSSGVLGLKSPFGTTESSSSRPGFIGIGSGKSSTSIEDTGVKIAGSLGNLIKGIGDYLVYETVKRTSSNSGLWGLFSSSSTSVDTSYLRLEDDLVSQIQGIMENARITINTFGTKLGTRSVEELNSILDTTAISLDVSTKGLTGEEALQALQAELGVAMNQLVRTAYPFLKDFQKLGEGLLTTLTRVVTDMDTVNLMFEQIGVNVQDMLLPWTLVDTSTSEAAIRMQANSKAYDDAVLSINNSTADFLDNTISYADSTREIYSEWGSSGFEQVTSTVQERLQTALNKTFTNTAEFITYLSTSTTDQITQALRYTAPELLTQVLAIKTSIEGLGSITASASTIAAELEVLANSNITSNLEKYKFLVDQFGDIDKFTESMQFFVDNFTSETEKTAILTAKVTQEMTRLGYASVDTKHEFTQLIKSLDPMVEADARLLKSLTNVQQGFAAMSEELDSLASSSGIDKILTTFKDAVSGTITGSSIGTTIAENITTSVSSAILAAPMDAIDAAITNFIIQPLMAAIATGASISSAISAASIRQVKDAAIQAVQAMQLIFSDREFLESIRAIGDIVGTALSQAASSISIITGNLSAATKVYKDAVKKATETQISLLKKQKSALESTKSAFEGFAKSLLEFADSLLLSDLSPLSPAEKYAQSKTAFEETYALAMSGDTDAAKEAMGKLQSVAQEFLQQSRSYYASSEAYTNDFNTVQEYIRSAAAQSSTYVTDIERQIGLLDDQLSTLGSIDETLTTIEETLAAALTQATKNVGTELVNGFTTLDNNVDGLLTREELGALGLATDGELNDIYDKLDSNHDGQISVLEAIQNAAEGTKYSINALNPILDKVHRGIISVADAVRALDAMNTANAAVGEQAIVGGGVAINAAAPTPIESKVIQAYNSILGRAPENAGLDYWSGIYSSTPNASYDQIAQNIFSSANGTSDTAAARLWASNYITEGYRQVLSRSPDAVGLSYWTDQLMSGAIRVSNAYTTIANTAQGGDRTAADAWLASHPKYVGHFASGGQHLGGVRIVGEQGPELEATGPARYWSNKQMANMLAHRTYNTSNSDDQLLIEEIKKLNEKIASLERTVAHGDMLNVAATERNSQQVAEAVNTSSTNTIHNSRIQRRSAIS